MIELATAPDQRAVVKRFDESFTGSLTSFLLSPHLAADKDSLETASQMTRRRLTWAREAGGGTSVSPSQLIVQTSVLESPAPRAEPAGSRGAMAPGLQHRQSVARNPGEV